MTPARIDPARDLQQAYESLSELADCAMELAQQVLRTRDVLTFPQHRHKAEPIQPVRQVGQVRKLQKHRGMKPSITPEERRQRSIAIRESMRTNDLTTRQISKASGVKLHSVRNAISPSGSSAARVYDAIELAISQMTKLQK